MKFKDATVLVTGANRGLGRALVDASLQAGARRVYAGARDPRNLAEVAFRSEGRVVALGLDITSSDSLAKAAEQASDVTLLINNAGVLASFGLLTSSAEAIARDFATNLFGTVAASKAFLPALERASARGEAALVNVLSVVSLANMPALGGYSASKAAASSITQALRGDLAKLKIAVHGVFAGAIDTDMVKDMDMAKTSPAEVARGILEGVERGEEDIFPDAMSRHLSAIWREDPKRLERQLASMSG
ncbi:MAG TPA: SDR family oxidoreductase [Polyangiaceae bacterium]|nr:SDR family oxidoreductase [Polyangiaceae bacterium]